MKLQEKEPFIANGVIRTLRIWRERCKPAPMIVTEEDIDSLAEWADHLHKMYEWTDASYVKQGLPIDKIPTQIKRRGR